VLFDFDTRSRWKREKVDGELLREVTLRVVAVPVELHPVHVPIDAKTAAAYARERAKLFAEVRGDVDKDPHVIPRNLLLISGKAKLQHMDHGHRYVGRNNRYKLPGLETYREAVGPGPRVVFELCHNFLDFADLLTVSRQHAVDVLVADTKADRWYFDRFIAWTERLFEQVVVSVSGGKDSTVLAYLAVEEAKRRGRRIGVYFLDEEVVYESTIEQVAYLMTLSPAHTIPLWLQLEFRLTNAVSLEEGQLVAWEAGKHKLWMRPKRKDSIQHPPWDRATETVRNRAKGFGFYDVIDNFERCYRGAAFLIGLRGAEAPNRWRAVTKNPVTIGGERVYWGTEKGTNTALYPLYDWNYFDVWRLIAEAGLRYSKIYDYQFRKGYPVTEMRVSSLIHERSFRSLVDLPEFEPKTYDRLQKRIKGIALAQETARSAKLFRCSKLPQNFRSWRSYRDHLLASYPVEAHHAIFVRRFSRHLDNEHVARQQCRQLICGDIENNLAIRSEPDPRDALIDLYDEVL